MNIQKNLDNYRLTHLMICLLRILTAKKIRIIEKHGSKIFARSPHTEMNKELKAILQYEPSEDEQDRVLGIYEFLLEGLIN